MTATIPGRWANLSKGQAFSIHLALSLLIFSSLVFVMVMWWFPGELFFLDGGWEGLKLVAIIDLVLGPALTLLLYKPQKPKLVLDMSLIACFQVAALAYGFYATHQQRTVAVVYADRNFTTLSAAAVAHAEAELIGKERTPQTVSSLDNSKPAMLLTPTPKPGEFKKYMSELFGGFPEPHERLDLFVKRGPEHAEIISKYAVTREKMKITGADVIVDEAIAKGGYELDDIEIHHFKARYAKGYVLYSKSEQKILDYLPIPWDQLIKKKLAENENQEDDENKTDTPSAEPLAESVEQ